MIIAGETGNIESIEKTPQNVNTDGLKPKSTPQKRGGKNIDIRHNIIRY